VIEEFNDFELLLKKKALERCDQLKAQVNELQETLRNQVAARISGDEFGQMGLFYDWAKIDTMVADIMGSSDGLLDYSKQLHNCFLEITRVSSEDTDA